MSEQAKKGRTTKDYISQIKKETGGVKDTKAHNADEIDWERHESEEEEEVVQQKKGVVVQGKVGTEKPQKLKDIFGDSQVQKPKTAKPKEVPKEKKQAGYKGGEKGDLMKPRFTNTKGPQNKEQPLKYVDNRDKFESGPKKFTSTAANILNKAAEENAKVKPTRDYLDKDTRVKYKEDEPEIAKPKFVNKNVDGEGNEPHFRDFNKNEDLFLRKIAESGNALENVYSEPRAEGDKEKKEKTYNKPYEPREYKKKEQKEEVELDSDGFEIVGSAKNRTGEYRPKKKYQGNWNGERKNFHKGDKKYQKRDRSASKENRVTEEASENPTGPVDVPKKADKATVKVDTNVKKLKDIFG